MNITSWLQYDFMRNALIAVLIITPLFGIMGTMIVNKKMAYFSDALGHSALTGTNLYDAVVANINGELEKVAELLKRNEAAAIPTTETQTAGTNEEYRKFDMNEFL